MVCVIPLAVTNCLNSSYANCGPLGESSRLGIPHSIVFVQVVEVIGKTSIHYFQCSSISTRIICVSFSETLCEYKHELTFRAEDCVWPDMKSHLLCLPPCQHPALTITYGILSTI